MRFRHILAASATEPKAWGPCSCPCISLGGPPALTLGPSQLSLHQPGWAFGPNPRPLAAVLASAWVGLRP